MAICDFLHASSMSIQAASISADCDWTYPMPPIPASATRRWLLSFWSSSARISSRPTNFASLSNGTINVRFEYFSAEAIDKVSQVNWIYLLSMPHRTGTEKDVRWMYCWRAKWNYHESTHVKSREKINASWTPWLCVFAKSDRTSQWLKSRPGLSHMTMMGKRKKKAPSYKLTRNQQIPAPR